MAEFFDVALRQRACRSFRQDPVDDALVERCLEAATHAPSAENRQPWVFVVVRDESLREAIGDLTRRAWRGGGRAFSEGRLAPALLADVDAGAEGGLSRAPVIIVVGGDTALGLESTFPSSVFPAVQNLLLAAGTEPAARGWCPRPRIGDDHAGHLVCRRAPGSSRAPFDGTPARRDPARLAGSGVGSTASSAGA